MSAVVEALIYSPLEPTKLILVTCIIVCRFGEVKYCSFRLNVHNLLGMFLPFRMHLTAVNTLNNQASE